ncbi:MAG TPA: branched-chain amino acid ABC transporter permease [Jatrophihabitans sp.]|nr:branched-chain amino acid ABC transporter permease [Jatrophihabitans sp.]
MIWDSILSGAQAAVGPVGAIYALAAIGLNMHFGYTGLLNFGQVGFMLVGAYAAAVAVSTYGLSLWIGVLFAVLCATALALLLGIPTLRLRADYLAITTIAAAEILRYIYRADFAQSITGGVYGLRQFANGFYAVNPFPSGSYGGGNFSFLAGDMWVMVITWGLVAIFSVLVWLLMRSPWGRVLRAIREDEDAARSLGKNVFNYKMQSLIIGGIIGAIAGVMLAISQQAVTPDAFKPEVTFDLYTLLILGGAARVFGPILGSLLFWFLYNFCTSLLTSLVSQGDIPQSVISSDEVGAVTLALVGLGLILLMVFRPQGILGDRREMLLDVR